MPELSNFHTDPRRAGPGSANWQKREHRPRGRASRVLATHRLQPDFERVAADRADAGPQPAGATRIPAGGRGSRHSQSFQSRRRTMTTRGRTGAIGELGLLALFLGLLALLVATEAIGGAAGQAVQGPGRGRRGRRRARRDPAGRPGDGRGRGQAARADGGQVAEDRRRAAGQRRSAARPGGGSGRRAPLRRHARAVDDGRGQPGHRRRPGVGRVAAGRGVGHRARHRRRAGRQRLLQTQGAGEASSWRAWTSPSPTAPAKTSWATARTSRACVAGNSAEFKGVAPDAWLVSLKVLGADGSGRTSDVIRAIDYAIAQQGEVRAAGDQPVAGPAGV